MKGFKRSAPAIGAVLLGLAAASSAQALQLLSNGSFEQPNIGAGNYTYPGNPWGTITPIAANQGGWTFNNAALVNGSSSNAWYGGQAPAGMDGVQFAALQATSSLSQSFTANAGSLQLSWLAAGRPWGMGDQSYQVLLDGQAVGGMFSTASDTSFGVQMLTLSGLTSGQSYQLAFQGLATSDDTAFIDNVSLSDVFAAPPPSAPVKTVYALSEGLPPGQTMLVDFDNPLAAGISFTGGYVRSGALGLDPGVSAPPPGDTSNYETVLGGQTATLTSIVPLSEFSFYMGSPDDYNSVEFIGEGYHFVLNGQAIWAPAAGGGGDQSWGRTISYDFGGFGVTQIRFHSSGNSFEFDNLAGRFERGALNLQAAVPEPATWMTLIMGFGTLGAVLRRRRAIAVRA